MSTAIKIPGQLHKDNNRICLPKSKSEKKNEKKNGMHAGLLCTLSCH